MSTELRDLVNILTRSHTLEVTQHGRTIGHRTQTALLTKLRDAVTSNIGSGNGGSSPAHTRTTIDHQALDTYTAIERQIRAWATNLDVNIHANWGDPTALLRTVQVQLLADARIDLHPYETTLRRWIHQIEDLIVDPPARFTIRDDDNQLRPCPRCQQRWAILDIGGEQERVPALVGSRRDQLDDTEVRCRQCDTIWHGITGLRELAGLLPETVA